MDLKEAKEIYNKSLEIEAELEREHKIKTPSCCRCKFYKEKTIGKWLFKDTIFYCEVTGERKCENNNRGINNMLNEFCAGECPTYILKEDF